MRISSLNAILRNPYRGETVKIEAQIFKIFYEDDEGLDRLHCDKGVKVYGLRKEKYVVFIMSDELKVNPPGKW